MTILQNAVGWLWEHWGDIVTWTLMLAALLLAVFPSKVAELERRPRWGNLWKWGLPALLFLLALSGFVESTRGNDTLRAQAQQAYTLSLVAATKTDIGALAEHMDEEFANLVAAINKKGPEKVSPPVKRSQLPPPVVEHIRYTETRTPSSNPKSPYGLQVVIQTDTTIQPAGFKITCDKKITDGEFFIAGQSVVMSRANAFSEDKKSFLFSFKYPPVTPETPIVVKLQSDSDIRVIRIEQIPPLF